MTSNPKFINPDNIRELSKEHIEKMLSKGYLPYKNKNGEIKWAYPANRIYKFVHRKQKKKVFFLFKMLKANFYVYLYITLAIAVVITAKYIIKMY